MSVEANKILFRRWFEEVISNRNLALVDDMVAEDYVLHVPGMPTPLDREGVKQLLGMFHAAFPDWQEQVDMVAAEGDLVVIRAMSSGTHANAFQGIPPTGKRVTTTGVGIARIVDGRIVESWVEYDALGLLQQLGAIPAPTAAG